MTPAPTIDAAAGEGQGALAAALAAQRAGRLAEAEAGYRRVLARRPDDADAVHLLGMLCQRTGRAPEALRLLARAIELDPSAPHFHNNRGNLLGRLGRRDEAADCFRRALALRPGYGQAWLNLGVALEGLGRWRESADAFGRAVALRPADAEARRRLGDALRRLGRPLDAAEQHREAIRLAPDRPEAYAALAADCGELGLGAEATECHRKMAELSPGSAAAGSDYLHLLHYDPAVSRRRLLEEARAWAARHADPLRPAAVAHDNEPDPERPLRVGFVSPDFREHPVARLAEPVLAGLDRPAFRTFCYHDSPHADDMTRRIRAAAGAWREVAGLADEALAAVIRRDRIDILVDLTGHMGGHRLTMFATSPAPVQVTHFNYPDTTGMAAMGWRVSDDLAEPPGAGDPHDRCPVERLMRLPRRAWCYQPTRDGPAVGPLPALNSGRVTFAALNKPLKHSPPCVALWARVLEAVPGSRLMLLGFEEPSQNEPMAAQFAARAVGPGRLRFVTRRPRRQYLSLYNEADLSLDPFPYNGGVTSCDGLWMGVPFVTLEGDSYLSRQGLMLLSNVGLSGLVAKTPEQYVERAAAAVRDLPRLAAVRAALRGRFAGCPVADGPGFARDLGGAYRRMWREWCGAGAGE